MVAATVEAMRQDWAGAGIDFVFLPDCDFELRKDSRLNNDFTLSADDRSKFPAAAGAFTQAQIAALIAGGSNDSHRDTVAAERPNTLLWLICERNAIEADATTGGWIYKPHIVGSWGSIKVDFVVLNKWSFAKSVQHSQKDASRAAHETGHFLNLLHTFRVIPEPATPAGAATTPAAKLDRWTKAIAAYLDQNLPAGSTQAAALQFLDNDYGGGVHDTPADPGPGLLALANLAAPGGADDALGPVASVSVQPAHVTGPLILEPDRNNPMSYYLDGSGTAPMQFSPDQIEVMRAVLIDGKRRRLVAAQLGDTAEPNVRICAVWSSITEGQAYGARATLKMHQAQHEQWRLKKFHLASQRAYADGDTVLYDGVWNQGPREQQVGWGWHDKGVDDEVAKRAAQGWRVAHIQAYRHPGTGGTGLRYNVIFEKGSQKQVVKLNLLKVGLDQAWDALMPAGNRLRHLDSAIDQTGKIRFAAVFEPGSQTPRYVADLPLADMIAAYDVERAKGRKLATLSVVWTAGGPRYSGIFDSHAADQMVAWLHKRERLLEVHDEMRCRGFKLRSLHTTTV
jgi:hypothetical protein